MKYLDKLRNSGLRPTKQRLQICEILFDTEKTFHFTINELDKKIKDKIDDKISKDTHEKIVNKLDSLKKLFYANYYIIDHELSHWVELLFVRIKEERSLFSESSESETFISLESSSTTPGLVLL